MLQSKFFGANFTSFLSCSTGFAERAIEDAECTSDDVTNPTQLSVQKFKTMDDTRKQSDNAEREEVRVKPRECGEENQTAESVKTPAKDTGLGSKCVSAGILWVPITPSIRESMRHRTRRTPSSTWPAEIPCGITALAPSARPAVKTPSCTAEQFVLLRWSNSNLPVSCFPK